MSNRYTKVSEDALDRRYLRDCGLLNRLKLRMFRRTFNRFALVLITRAHERGLVNSVTMHELDGMLKRMLRL